MSRRPKKKRLEWGETPWDAMPREELLREVQRGYSALTAARGVLSMTKALDPSSPFWIGPYGTGGRALAKCNAVVEPIEARFDGEDIYRSFFRYADDLLFGTEIGSGWRVCPNGHMFASNLTDLSAETCSICKGAMRAITWADLAPKAAPDQSEERKEKI